AVLDRQHGILVKTIGDAVMALWNTPVALTDHAERGCAAALEMLEALERLNAEWHERGIPLVVIRIGIHTGAASVGNFGTGRRLEYDARGDAANVASRLEGLGKQYGTGLLLSAATRTSLNDGFVCRYLDHVRV